MKTETRRRDGHPDRHPRGLALQRNIGQSITLDIHGLPPITVTLVGRPGGTKLKLITDAPPEVAIWRTEQLNQGERQGA